MWANWYMVWSKSSTPVKWAPLKLVTKHLFLISRFLYFLKQSASVCVDCVWVFRDHETRTQALIACFEGERRLDTRENWGAVQSEYT